MLFSFGLIFLPFPPHLLPFCRFALVYSPNRRFVAVGEKTGESLGPDLAERFLVNIYDLNTLKRRKKLQTTSEVNAKEFISISFSADNKYLLTLTGGPDYTLIVWLWEKLRPIASKKLSGGKRERKRKRGIESNRRKERETHEL